MWFCVKVGFLFSPALPSRFRKERSSDTHGSENKAVERKRALLAGSG